MPLEQFYDDNRKLINPTPLQVLAAHRTANWISLGRWDLIASSEVAPTSVFYLWTAVGPGEGLRGRSRYRLFQYRALKSYLFWRIMNRRIKLHPMTAATLRRVLLENPPLNIPKDWTKVRYASDQWPTSPRGSLKERINRYNRVPGWIWIDPECIHRKLYWNSGRNSGWVAPT